VEAGDLIIIWISSHHVIYGISARYRCKQLEQTLITEPARRQNWTSKETKLNQQGDKTEPARRPHAIILWYLTKRHVSYLSELTGKEFNNQLIKIKIVYSCHTNNKIFQHHILTFQLWYLANCMISSLIHLHSFLYRWIIY